MLWWLVDNANFLFLFLGIVALCFGVAFWLNKRVKYLGGVGAAVVAIALLWLLTRIVVTDRKQLELNLNAMAEAVVAGKRSELLEHFAKDFEFRGYDRASAARFAVDIAARHKVGQVRIWSLEVDEVSREQKFATVGFNMTVFDNQGAVLHVDQAQCRFVFENDKWKLQQAKFNKEGQIPRK
ncbi:MAG: hypothetical protein L0Y72_01990 [Gemmataceae bacterium]|nr:hypothetical protein [Gemmataceae bacterium]MCI0737787.1 hypothetical protein [Gemmataceae bacterium]